jgi:hypothetical protein
MQVQQTSDSQIPMARLIMALFATLAFLMGIALAVDSKTTMALSNFCGTLFFMFAYHNPAMLYGHGLLKTSLPPEQIVQRRYLWSALAVGILALVLEVKEHLPLG